MKRYEYLTRDLEVKGTASWDGLLNQWGKDGWELVGVVPMLRDTGTGGKMTDGARLLFKREAPTGTTNP